MLVSTLGALRSLGIGGAAVLVGCTTVGQPVLGEWNIPMAGSSWTVADHNTGSYGKDLEFDVKRGESVWQGQPAITFTNSVTGAAIMARQDGKWMAIVGRDGKPLVTYDPPVGYEYPLKVGKQWATTHRMTVHATGSTREMVFACKVESYEPVTVRAGTFNAFKINCKGPGYDDTLWSSADYGMFVKTILRRFDDHPQGRGTQERELVALHLAR